MNVLIIEDEQPAAQRLETLIKAIVPDAYVLGKLDSVKTSVEWFNRYEQPDVVFMDIQLADGISFSIFEKCEIKSPIIFTTAYDEYAIKAFKVNSVDYLLKPVDKDDLSNALNKIKTLSGSRSNDELISNLDEAIKMLTRKYKSRFVVKVGEHIKTIDVGELYFFFSQDKTTFCVNKEGRNIILDYSLEELEEMLNPEKFYRINRKYLISSESIKDIISYTNSRLKLVLKSSQDNDIIVARERVQDFKGWLDR
jgi:DNA-binding LytR/AlgR family response regulator